MAFSEKIIDLRRNSTMNTQDLELRDWFAGQALTGILMNPNTPRPETYPFEQHAASLAEQAYAYANAMAKERLKPQPDLNVPPAAPPEKLAEAPGAFGPEGLQAQESGSSPTLPPETPIQQMPAPELPAPHDLPGTPP